MIKNGFSLIELMIFLAIGSVVLFFMLDFSSTVVLQFKRYDTYQNLSNEARQTYALFHRLIAFGRQDDNRYIVQHGLTNNSDEIIIHNTQNCSGSVATGHTVRLWLQVNTAGERSLFCKSNGKAQEVVNGVQCIQFRYVVFKNNKVSYAHQPKNWDNVVRVDIGIVFYQTNVFLEQKNTTYLLFDKPCVFPDPAMRYEPYFFSIHLKNHA